MHRACRLYKSLTFQHIRKTLQHISLYNTFFNQNAKKKQKQLYKATDHTNK